MSANSQPRADLPAGAAQGSATSGMACLLLRRVAGQPQQVERTADALQVLAGHVQIRGGGRELVVSQQPLQRGEIDARFEQMAGETVTQRVDPLPVLDLRPRLE